MSPHRFDGRADAWATLARMDEMRCDIQESVVQTQEIITQSRRFMRAADRWLRRNGIGSDPPEAE